MTTKAQRDEILARAKYVEGEVYPEFCPGDDVNIATETLCSNDIPALIADIEQLAGMIRDLVKCHDTPSPFVVDRIAPLRSWLAAQDGEVAG